MATKSKLTQSVDRGDRYGPEARDKSRRVQTLYRALLASHGTGPSRTVVEAQCLKVAELVAGAEALRAALLASESPSAALINSVTRLKSTAARAERALDKLAPPKTDADAWAEAWEKSQQGSE